MSLRRDSSSQESSAESTVTDSIAPGAVIDHSLPERFRESTNQGDTQPPVLMDDSKLSEQVSRSYKDAVVDVVDEGKEVSRMVTTLGGSRTDPE